MACSSDLIAARIRCQENDRSGRKRDDPVDKKAVLVTPKPGFKLPDISSVRAKALLTNRVR